MYTPLPIQEYLEKLKESGYTEEDLQHVEEFRKDAELMTFAQYKMLVEQKVLIRTKKLKTPRNMYVKEDKVYYLNHYHKKYEYSAYFSCEE